MFPLTSLWPNGLTHLFLCGLLGLGLYRWVSRKPDGRRAAIAIFLLMAAGLGLATLTAPALPGNLEFAVMLASCWTLGLVVPAFGVAMTVLLARSRRRGAWAFGFFTAAVALATIDAFVIEPRTFEIHRVTISAPQLTAPLRIALLADLQTDRPGGFEQRVLEATKREAPDLVLFAGDLIQSYDDEEYRRAWETLRSILRGVDLRPPLGSFVVSGDSEWRPTWVYELHGTGVQLLGPPTDNVQLREDVDLTGLPLGRTKAPLVLERPHEPRYHIVLGHRPDYALGDVDADLMLAGHTHGGQVQIPGFGPPLTLSRVPRAWAAGVVARLSRGRTLVISRGLGMERGVAPRLRFMCLPELVIIDLVPATP